VANIYSHIPTVYMTIYELLIYKKYSYNWNLAFDSLKEIPNLFSMLKENGILCFVRENSNFILNNDVYKILSPQKGDEEFEPYKFDNDEILNFVKSCVQRISKINNYFKKYNDETESIISNKTFKFIKEKLKNEIDDLYRDFNNTNFNLDDNTKAELKKIINKNKHKYNIVFGLMDNKNNTKFRLLMCGDEEKKNLKSIIDKNKIKEIGVMKVSHHGTPAYSSDYGLDKVESALIPYSYPNNKFGNWTIDDLTYSKHPYTEYCNPNVTKYY
jgi:hypothetical protein